MSRRYFIGEYNGKPLSFAPLGDAIGNEYALNECLNEVTFQEWFVFNIENDLITKQLFPSNIPTETDYWQNGWHD